MLRTLTVGFSGRAVSIALLFLPALCLAATAGDMTSSLLIGNARVDIMTERTTLPLPVKDIFRWVKSAAESVTTSDLKAKTTYCCNRSSHSQTQY
jgi:hypothetical protein